ncbi:MAG: cobalamin biosynthesis protein CbiD [Chloroflexota bacterium]|nr:MAG: cobalamin biosynthesis protein CbiD [Chloroflexota bacterium]
MRRRQRNEGISEELWRGRRRGYTTGACAAAAAQAAAVALFADRQESTARVEAPGGVMLSVPVAVSGRVSSSRGQIGTATVIKESGDHPDVTHGAEIRAEVESVAGSDVTICAGVGIGRVTRPGLAIQVGEPAINPVPLRMIERAVAAVLPPDTGVRVTISVPRGEELARKTFNARLGIEGGLSILGTTGVVETDSEESYKSALARQVDLALAAGQETLYLVPGDAGERFVVERLGVSHDAVVWTSNFVGYILQRCAQRHVPRVVLAGHIGKLVKVAAGIFQTHNRLADARLETLAAYAALHGAGQETVATILRSESAEAAAQLLISRGHPEVFQTLARRAAERARSYVGGTVAVDCILISLRGEILGSTMR